MSQQDPFYDVVIVHEKAPEMVSLPKWAQVIPKRLLPPDTHITMQVELTEHGYETIRAIVEDAIQKFLKGDNNNGNER